MSNFTFVSFSPVVPSSSMFMLFCFFLAHFLLLRCVCLSLSLSPRWSLSLHRHLSCYLNSRRPLEFDLNVSSHPDFYFCFDFSVGLDRPVHLDHFLRLSLCVNHPVIDHIVSTAHPLFCPCLVIVFIRSVSFFSMSTFIFRFVFNSLLSCRLSSISVVVPPLV